jgi:hypothetical protein
MPPRGGGGGERAAAFLLTFDVGRILVSADPAGGRLTSTHIREPDAIPGGFSSASEADPWWRLLGCALAGVEAAAKPRQVRLHFQIAGDRRRAVALELDGSEVRAAIEATA